MRPPLRSSFSTRSCSSTDFATTRPTRRSRTSTRQFAPFEDFSAFVAQALRAGLRDPADPKALERRVLQIFERAHRVVVPSAAAWHLSGDVVAGMARKEGLEIDRMSRALANAILLAVSRREAGCVLVTADTRDFLRIRRYVTFEFMQAWSGNRSGAGWSES